MDLGKVLAAFAYLACVRLVPCHPFGSNWSGEIKQFSSGGSIRETQVLFPSTSEPRFQHPVSVKPGKSVRYVVWQAGSSRSVQLRHSKNL